MWLRCVVFELCAMETKPNFFSLKIGNFEARARGAEVAWVEKLSQTQIVMWIWLNYYLITID